jgi:hypothetical protein
MADQAEVSRIRANVGLTDDVTTPVQVSRIRAQVGLVELTGGGTVPGGTNPPAGTLPSTTPQIFGILEDPADGTIIETVAERHGGPFADDSDYWGGFKEARVGSFGTIEHKFTTIAGGLQLATQRILLHDEDRYYRSLWGIKTIRGRKWSTFLIEHSDRINKVATAPYRLNAGMVVDHGPESDFTYQITVEGMLGRHVSRAGREKKAPANRITPLDIPSLATRWADGWSPPIGYGYLDDEAAAKPQGAVPGTYIATANLQAVFGGGALNVVADFYVFFAHAVQYTNNLYYTPPGWTASTPYLVGDVIRPAITSNGFLYQCTVAGTSGSSAPTWPTTIGNTVGDGSVTWKCLAVDDPELRFTVPESAYNQVVADPHRNWSVVTGTANKYLDWNGFRFHVVLVRNDHRFAKALREGRMTLSGNFRGIEDAGDGTGTLITDPARIFQHFWSNFIENTYKTGAWFAVPPFGSYSLFDTTTIEAVKTFNDTLVSGSPVKVGMLIGLNGQQTHVFDVARDMTTSWQIKPGENRHGQIITWIRNPSASAAVTLNQQDDLVSITTKPARAAYANVVRYRYGYRYVPPVATQLEGPEGEPMPAQPVHEHANWVSGLKVLKNTSAIALNNDQEEYLDLDLFGVRDQATADVYAARALEFAVGPVLEGPIEVEIATGLQGLKQLSTEVGLGTVVGITHIEGLGASGFVGMTVPIEHVRIQLPEIRVTLSGVLET